MASVLSINAKDLATQIKPPAGFGSVSPEEFGTMLAQKSKTVASKMGVDVNTALSTVSATNGIGKYGISASNLESSGFLKPGTVDRYLSDPGQLETVLSSSSVWTGKSGVNSLSNVLGNDALQTDMQSEIYSTAFNGLKSAGTISGLESSDVVGSLTNVAADFGVDNTTAWLDNDIADAAMGLDMDIAARSGMLSTDFISNKASSLLNTDIATTVQNQLGGDLSGLANNAFSQLAGSIGGISVVQGAGGQILGGAADALSSLTSSASGLLGNLSGQFGSLFGGATAGAAAAASKIKLPKTITPPEVTQTIDRAGIESAMQGLVNNAKVALPNYTGIVNASSFQLPSLSGLVDQARQLNPGQPVTVSRCDGAPELIAPTRAECEAAGGTWVETTINTTGTQV
jgi:hypothetical protein